MEALMDMAYLHVSTPKSDDELNQPGYAEALMNIACLRVSTPQPNEEMNQPEVAWKP